MIEHPDDMSRGVVPRYAPVALFAYNRPDHLQKTIEALQANSEASSTVLYIFSDAPKNVVHEQAVREVRHYIRGVAGFAEVHIVERRENYGLARSIIEGVTSVCDEHGRIIVLEDDIVVSKYFLKYMNDALERYELEERVVSIASYQYPIKNVLPETFFLKCADCWGWATWSRGWKLFEPDGRLLLREMIARRLTRRFDFDGSYPYTRMLRNQIAGKNNSWAIRWYASSFLQDKLTLYPGRSLVMNIGNDGSGTHCSATNAFTSDISECPVKVELIDIVESSSARKLHIMHYRGGWLRLPHKIISKFFRRARKVCA